MAEPEGFEYVASFLDEPEQQTLLDSISHLEFHHDSFRGQQLKRSYAQFGFAYASTGRRLHPVEPFPPFLESVITKALPLCPPGTTFDQCIITRYPSGAGIGWHVDAPSFGECIAGLSLGSGGRFQLRAVGTKDVAHELVVASGSMYVMSGPARWNYQHQVVPVRSERYSLTFRSVNRS